MKRSILVPAIASTMILATTYSPMLGNFTGTVAAAQTVQNTTYSYQHDANGNLTQVTDPMGRVSTLTYDPLNRVIQQLQPAPATGAAQPAVSYGYDALDQLSTVTDPRSLVTTYTNDGLGNQSSLVSPDSGTTGRTYDEAGNLITSTDARGKVTTYTYDVLNRLTKIAYASGTPTVFEYDGGASGAPNAIGRLTKMTDESGNTTYGYDQLGRVLVKTQTTTTGSTSLVQLTNYTYDDAGRLTSLTYPSGIRILYTYDAAGHVNGLVMNPSDGKGNTDTSTNTWILQQVTYAPFGPAQSWTWGNSTDVAPNVYNRTFDLDGRVTSYPLGTAGQGGLIRTVSYDASSRVTAFVHTTAGTGAAAPTFDQSFSYDNLDRLTGVVTNTSTQGYSYDANGNRTEVRYGGSTYGYVIDGASNRLATAWGPAPGEFPNYDAAGNLQSNGTVSFSYSDRGRPTGVWNGSAGGAGYAHNGLDQRVIKGAPEAVIATGLNFYAYDGDGKLLGEYDATGKPLQETVYLGSTPVAVVTPQATAGTNLFYVYTDQINTPRIITSAATNAMVWRWDMADPFGVGSPNENPSGAGAFTYNPRMPGQLFDKETNHFYNYYRTYDPQIGRYVQSDPIGLDGGINTYGYVKENPVKLVDYLGLADSPTEGVQGLCVECLIPIVRGASFLANLARNALQEEQACTITEKRASKIFGKREGHILDTPANRKLLEDVANDKNTTLGTDAYGNEWSASMQADGTQVWTQTRNGEVINGGVNLSPQSFNPTTGLSSSVRPGPTKGIK